MCQRKEKLLTKCYASKKAKTAAKVHLALLFKYEVQKEFQNNFFQNLETFFHVSE